MHVSVVWWMYKQMTISKMEYVTQQWQDIVLSTQWMDESQDKCAEWKNPSHKECVLLYFLSIVET